MVPFSRFLLPALAVLTVAPLVRAAAPDTNAAAGGGPPPEWMRKIYDIFSTANPRQQVASPLYRSKLRLGWPWLANGHGIQLAQTIARPGFRGPAALFDRLDRDGDGVLRADDFDWSDEAPYVRQEKLAFALFNRIDASANGRITAEEWQALSQQVAGAKGYLTPDDLYRILNPPASRAEGTRPAGKFERLMGFFNGELGSPAEGPDVGALAPDFTLTTPDGKTRITLSSYRENKPVVLIFGNFT